MSNPSTKFVARLTLISGRSLLSGPTLVCALTLVCGLLLASNAFAYKFINANHCPNGSSWGASNQPLSYYINENGSADVSMSQVQSIAQDSFEAWGEPCCSSFSASYSGTTSRTALQNGGDVVLSWEENSWPTQLGRANQTIAVTLTSVYNSCEIASAPIHFNGVGFQFCASGSGCTDLRSIATHEIGHNLGLDHSQHTDATMYFAYQGGTSARSLSQDDIAGVCALYPASCSCSNDSDCGPNQVCNASQCEEAPCQSDNDCPGGQECNTGTGDCQVPSCGSDNDCDEGYVCSSQGKCTSTCPVCQTCTTQEDCGGNGYCADVGGQGKCITSCGQDGSCPGDSRCFRYDDYYLCLNPDAASAGICPSSYTCGGDGGGEQPTGSCAGLGNTCDPSTQDFSQCTADNDACLTLQTGESICSCMCSTDADCDDGVCMNVSNGNKACVPSNSSEDPCDGVSCDSGEVCDDGQCVDDGSSESDAGGQNNNNNPGPDAGFDDSGTNHEENEGPQIEVADQANRKSADSTCSATGPANTAPGSLMLMALFGLGVWWRKKT